MNSIDHMKAATFQELKEALKIKRKNDELLEYLASSLKFILRYGKKYNIPIPESDKILDMINKLVSIENEIPLPTEFQQRNKTTDEETEPINTINIVFRIKFILADYKLEIILLNLYNSFFILNRRI